MRLLVGAMRLLVGAMRLGRRYAPFASSGVRTHASMIAGLKSAALNHSAILAFFHIFNVESALIFYSVSMGVKDNF